MSFTCDFLRPCPGKVKHGQVRALDVLTGTTGIIIRMRGDSGQGTESVAQQGADTCVAAAAEGGAEFLKCFAVCFAHLYKVLVLRLSYHTLRVDVKLKNRHGTRPVTKVCCIFCFISAKKVGIIGA